ncbi:MAG TPA: group 1 truncated hemoglobin [Tepidisphaeraceae bacterium]|nr:group 1 truncated hemoglobin [Tepidisphaeraceae bacterium]
MLFRTVTRHLLPIGCLLLVAGCGPAAMPAQYKNQPDLPPGQTTLYEQLGGGSAIYAISDNFIDRVLQDPRVNFAREGHPNAFQTTPDSVGKLKLYWAQYLDMLADGPQIYEGRNLAEQHRGMDISEGEWLACLEDLKATLDQFHVPIPQQKALMTRVAATHDAVVAH